MSEKTYTKDEVIAMLLEERSRAARICFRAMQEHNSKYISKKKLNDSLAFVSKSIAEECRLLMNAINGGNAISVSLGETTKDRIIKEYFQNNRIIKR